MGEITAASQEQSKGIEQVNQAIAQMDEVTQQNAALVEEAAAAAGSLQEQAGNLSQLVGTFRIGNDRGGAAKQALTMTPAPAASVAADKVEPRLAAMKPAPARALGRAHAPQSAEAGQWEAF